MRSAARSPLLALPRLAFSLLNLSLLTLSLLLAPSGPARAADPSEAKFPLGPQLRVLAEDVESPAYRRLIDEMLLTDLNAEWARVETEDNAARFLEQHGGRDAVLAD